MINYLDYEEYDSDDLYSQRVEKIKKNTNKTTSTKKKGHQSIHNVRVQDDDISDDLDIPTLSSSLNIKNNTNIKVDTNKTQNKQQQKFIPGQNSHTIKQITIDFDRVANIEKISGEFKGRITFGIKFTFTNKNASYKIIWFGDREVERDGTFNREFGYWKNLQSTK